MISAFDLLLKFSINLLKPNRPQVWRSIRTDNAAFRARVACMKGHEEILRQIGYTELREKTLQFPEYVLEPDKPKLCVVAAELLIAKLEVEQLSYTEPMSGSVRKGQQPQIPRSSFVNQQFSAQLQTTGTVGATVANQQLQQAEMHHRDTASPAGGHSQLGYQTQYHDYMERQDVNIQQYSDAPTTSAVAYCRYGRYLCVHECMGVNIWVCTVMCKISISV